MWTQACSIDDRRFGPTDGKRTGFGADRRDIDAAGDLKTENRMGAATFSRTEQGNDDTAVVENHRRARHKRTYDL